MTTPRLLLSLGLAIALAACQSETPPEELDIDGDGVVARDDCNDLNPAIYPGATELCDSLDNDCNGEVDDGEDRATFYGDSDGDGYGDPASTQLACEQPAGFVANAEDCNDASAAFNPGAPETDCTDPNDYNCDGSVGYADADNDGFAACEECDDLEPRVNPDAEETCNEADDDCDGQVDEEATDAATWYQDADEDGFGGERFVEVACAQPDGFVDNATDCDDLDGSSFPGGTEVCDEADNDCDGDVDEEVQTPFFADTDGDGFGDAAVSTLACAAPAGFVTTDTDCDDGARSVSPVATELCNTFDDDCDGDIDEATAADAPTWYDDLDGDGYGDPAAGQRACTQPSGTVDDRDDCDDADDAINPAADELCDSVDNDCDGTTDEASALDAKTWFLDDDADGYGDGTSSRRACAQPSGYVGNSTDCDDTDDAVSPDADELCATTVDDDCDGVVNEDDAADADTWYEDRDQDTFGSTVFSKTACTQPTGHVSDNTDCDDASKSTNPDADETCDGEDDNCDGNVDEEAVDAAIWYLDDDEDGYGLDTETEESCTQPSGYVADDGDCDDGDEDSNPDADELCSTTVDDDCDGQTNERDAADADTWYLDDDGDGFGDEDVTTTACTQPSDYVDDDTDCDDDDIDVNPDATEECGDGVDNDCDGDEDDEEDSLGSNQTCPGASCEDILTTRTDTLSSGAYWIQPGSTAYQVYCEMTVQSGGWTLLGKFTNNDGVTNRNWTPYSAAWTTSNTFGTSTNITTNADAKSQAFNELGVDQLMIRRGSSTSLVTNTSCMRGNSLRTVMRRNSASGSGCAWSCGLSTVSSPWSGQSYQHSQLSFRCADSPSSSYRDPSGYYLASDDNSMITTLNNGSYRDYNFGLGAGYGSSASSSQYADWDSATGDSATSSDTTLILLYGR